MERDRAAFQALERFWPAMTIKGRPPIRVTIMGAGTVGKHAVEFATKYGDDARNEAFMRSGLAGVEVATTGRNLTRDPDYLRGRLTMTDILVDATQRHDASVPLIPNAWIGLMPEHAVICDLVVDPYLPDSHPPVVRGIEGIPQGNLDQWEFAPDDPAWDRLPPGVPTDHRRVVVSCYSWPGVRPEPCMHVYGSQLAPILETLLRTRGLDGLTPATAATTSAPSGEPACGRGCAARARRSARRPRSPPAEGGGTESARLSPLAAQRCGPPARCRRSPGRVRG